MELNRNTHNGRFNRGYTYRVPKPYWNKEWLYNEYVVKFRSTKDIAKEFGCRDTNIQYFLAKFSIPTRNTEEIRSIKYWGSKGQTNPMYGRTKSRNPNWKGGITPERQDFYSSLEWKQFSKKIWRKYRGTCVRCKMHQSKCENKFHIHHIKSFRYVELRMLESNVVLLCKECHSFVHSRKNINHEFIL